MISFNAMPKVELHLHFDTSISYNGVSKLDPSITLEDYRRDIAGPEHCDDLADFLSHVPPIMKLLQSQRGLEVLVQDIFQQLVDDGVVYTELRFAPLQHLEGGLTPSEVVRIVEATVDRESQNAGVESRLILCSLRHFSTEQSMETVQLVDQFRGSRVVGFDLAGDEAGYPLSTHLEAFDFAKDRGLFITSHAGEACGAESVWETLDKIHPPRIGHGVRSIEDPALIQRLKQERIHLEMCPSCNVQLDVFPSYKEHCIDQLYREGLSLGVSTDNRTLTPITLTREYEKLASTFGWTKDDFLTCNLNTLEASFIPAHVKDALRKRIIAGYAD